MPLNQQSSEKSTQEFLIVYKNYVLGLWVQNLIKCQSQQRDIIHLFFYGTCPKVYQVTNNSALRSTLIMSILAQTLFPRFGKQKKYNISSEKGHNSVSTWQTERKKYGFANLMWSSHQ